MEDLLPFLAGGIWLLYKWYTSSQKKKTAERNAEPKEGESKEPSLLEQILMGQEKETDFIFDDNAETESEPVPLAQPTMKSKLEEARKQQSAFLNVELSDFDEEGESSIELEQIDWNESEHKFQQDFQDDIQNFDLKKAVIYSEVLNPPYIDYK